MKTIPTPGSDAKGARRADPPLTLRDLVEALCAGCVPPQGIELMLDRIEGQK